MTAKAVRVLRDRKVDFPEAANVRVKALRRLFAWALENEIGNVRTNPARDVSYIRNSSQGHHTWTVVEVQQYEQRHPVGTKARLALALLLYTGTRRSDLVVLGRQHVRNGWIKFTAQKNRRRRPVTIEVPLLPALQSGAESNHRHRDFQSRARLAWADDQFASKGRGPSQRKHRAALARP